MANIGTGRGGKSFQDRKLAADVRNLALKNIQTALKGDKKSRDAVAKWPDYKKQMLLRLASTLLPRLNEVTGDDGGPITLDIGPQLTKIYGAS